MQAEDRIIHFSTELLHAPTVFQKPQLQKLYFDLAQTRAGYDNTDFTVPGRPRFHSHRGARTQSVALFLPDRIVLIEEWADISLSEYVANVREVASRVVDLLPANAFNVHVATLRSTFALTHCRDARVFLLERVCRQEGRLEPHFHRPIAIGGMRFVLPQVPGHRGELHVAIESFRHAVDEVLVEIKGIFGDAAIGREQLDALERNVESVRAFVTSSIHPFLDQYDTP